ncbi:MAG: DUF4340 domain-containing protein [Candidatus Zixiibacteriota bacterium]
MKKSVFILGGIFLLFVIVYFFLIQKEKKIFAPVKLESFLTLDSASVDKIQFSKFDTKMVFQKIGENWFMTEPDSFRADDKAIGQLLNAVCYLEVGEIISSNPEKQSFFQVDNFTGTTISFFTKAGLQASLVVGKTSKDLLHTYMRKASSDEVYLSSIIFNSIAQRNVEEWKDRSIFVFDPQQIQELEFSSTNVKFKLTRSDSLWNLSLSPYRETTKAKEVAVNDYLLTLSNIKADEMAKKPEIAQLDFGKLKFELTVTLLDSRIVRLFVVQLYSEADRYYAKTDQAANVFVLYEYTFRRLNKKPSDFQSG